MRGVPEWGRGEDRNLNEKNSNCLWIEREGEINKIPKVQGKEEREKVKLLYSSHWSERESGGRMVNFL